jgi:tetratricopeptide (TPR) repeat protein
LRPFTIRFSLMIGRKEFDKAIDYLRAGLKGDTSDLASLEMIAHCHDWAGRSEEAIASCREALGHDPNSFDMHVMLSRLFAAKDEHADAANHARKGLETYPEPLPKLPRSLILTLKIFSRLIPSLRGLAPDAEAALLRAEADNAAWFNWAKRYLSWYDATYGETVKPVDH